MMSLGSSDYTDPGSPYAASGFDAFIAANPVSSSLQGGVAALSAATQFIKNLETQIEQAFGIGAGRREADRITPYQNQLVSAPGAPLGIINTAYALAADPAHNNPTDLNEIYQLTKQAIDTFYRYIGAPTFTDTTHWPDGRASKQAYATIMPYADDVLKKLKAQLISVGGVLIPIANTSAAGSVGAQLSNKLTQLSTVGDPTKPRGSTLFAGVGGGSMAVLLAGVIIIALLAQQGDSA